LKDSRQAELGIKRRGAKPGVEVKGLVAVTPSGLNVAPFVGPIETWTKWTSALLDLQSHLTIVTRKQRWVRKFDTSGAVPTEVPLDANELPMDNRPLPALGCNVELTKIEVHSKPTWWTLGFESFGNIHTVEDHLRAVATSLAAKQPPLLSGGLITSYPGWLKDVCA
jgi:hypothetical protein